MFIWGAARVAVPPQIYVIATMIFLFTVAMMIITVWQQRRAEKLAAVRPDEPDLGAGAGARLTIDELIAREREPFRSRTRARGSCTTRRAGASWPACRCPG